MSICPKCNSSADYCNCTDETAPIHKPDPGYDPRDLAIMPMGEHTGKQMKDVPAGYYDFIDGQDWIDKWPMVKEYIAFRRELIDKDLEL